MLRVSILNGIVQVNSKSNFMSVEVHSGTFVCGYSRSVVISIPCLIIFHKKKGLNISLLVVESDSTNT